MYLLYPGLDQTEEMICQYFYFLVIREAVQKEFAGCDTCQHTKRSVKKYGKFSAKLADDTPWNKLCVDIIGPCKIRIKGKDDLILKSVTMIRPVTGWFEMTQYSNKKAMAIDKLVTTTWMAWYPLSVEITYDRGG